MSLALDSSQCRSLVSCHLPCGICNSVHTTVFSSVVSQTLALHCAVCDSISGKEHYCEIRVKYKVASVTSLVPPPEHPTSITHTHKHTHTHTHTHTRTNTWRNLHTDTALILTYQCRLVQTCHSSVATTLIGARSCLPCLVLLVDEMCVCCLYVRTYCMLLVHAKSMYTCAGWPKHVYKPVTTSYSPSVLLPP